MGILPWAEGEIELAIERERRHCEDEDDASYGIACYESALKAYKSLMEDGHTGLSIGITKSILMNLIDGKPLSPIEDTDDIWCFSYEADGVKVYQCTRMYALFKRVYPDGTVDYSNNDSCYCVNIHNTKCTYSNGFVRRIIEEMFPITMPYCPGKPIKVYCEEFLTDEKNGDFDTMAIHHAIKPDGTVININRYFKEYMDSWAEIDANEFGERKRMADDRLNNKKEEE